MNGKYQLQYELKNGAVTYRYGESVLHLTKLDHWMISSSEDHVSKDMGWANCPKVEPFPGKTQEWVLWNGAQWQPGNVELAY